MGSGRPHMNSNRIMREYIKDGSLQNNRKESLAFKYIHQSIIKYFVVAIFNEMKF